MPVTIKLFTMTIRISGLPGTMTNEDLYALARPFGSVRTYHVVFDQITGKSKRFGFINMAYEEDAAKLIKELDGKSISEGQTLRLTPHKGRIG